VKVQPRIWFITGVSTGFGLELAKAALGQGDIVAGTVRRTEDAPVFEGLAPDRAHAFQFDVTQTHAAPAIAAQVVEKFGHADVIVNNAGFGLVGAVEELSDDDIRYQMDVNFFGALAVMRAFLPHLRARRAGRILNLSSIAGVAANPGLGLYNASKFALEGVSEALAKELAPLGVKVTIIEPGPFRTEFAGRSLRTAAPIADYEATAGAIRRYFEQANGKQVGDPVKAAHAMLKLVELENPPLRLVMGNPAVNGIRNKLQGQLAELAENEAWSRSLDYEG
jgi:NAD(P)-dependent dehydrogenase (short-subunit alcohol dehydrogenase family)